MSLYYQIKSIIINLLFTSQVRIVKVDVESGEIIALNSNENNCLFI